MTAAAFLALCLVQAMAAMSPGPAVFMAARTSTVHGMRSGAFVAAGIGAGAVFWAASALFGLALLFKLFPSTLTVLKLLGGGYLCWSAFQIWRHAREPAALRTAQGRTAHGAGSAFWLGVATQLSNPKPVIFFSAVFSGMVPPGTSTPWILALLCVVFITDFTWNVFVARLFSFEQSRRAYLSLKTVIDRCFGGLLALLGLSIVFT